MKHILPYSIFETAKNAEPFIVLPSKSLKNNYSQIKSCVDLVLKTLQLKGADLMMEIAMVETRLGTLNGSIRTSGNGGRGVWQIDKIAFDDARDIKNHPQLKKYHYLVKTNLGIDLSTIQWDDCNKLIIGCIVSRLIMVLKNFTPNEVSRKQRALQWKKFYNTSAGLGTPEKYWNTVQECLKTLNIPDKWAGLTYLQADAPVYVNNNQLDNGMYKAAPDSTRVSKPIHNIQTL